MLTFVTPVEALFCQSIQGFLPTVAVQRSQATGDLEATGSLAVVVVALLARLAERVVAPGLC